MSHPGPDLKVRTNTPFPWNTALLSEEVKDLLLETYVNSDGQHLKGRFVIGYDPVNNQPSLRTIISDAQNVIYGAHITTGNSDLSMAGALLYVASLNMYVNLTSQLMERVRTPTTFKAGSGASNGDNTIWTPTAGKKFRIMGLFLSNGTANAQTIQIKDNTAGTVIFAVVLPATVGANVNWAVGLQNGYLSTAANNVVDMNISSANAVYYSVWGTEE